jgi:putative Mn2+ efflux pump MntP
MLTEITYLIYLGVSAVITVWVARTLSRNGLVFLVEAFGHDEKLATSVNHLLVVGFYLINLGYVALALRLSARPTDVAEAIEHLSTKIGLVLLVVGAMHFFNVLIIARLGRKLSQFLKGQQETAVADPLATLEPPPNTSTVRY